MTDQEPLVWTLSGFADEISPDLATQLDVLGKLGIGHVELRSIDGVNVLDLTDAQLDEAQRRLDAQGVRVSAIGSPLGKVPITEPFEATVRRLDRALDVADRFGVRLIRLFSFYPGEVGREAAFDEAVRRLRAMAEAAAARGIVLAHENEKEIVGETAADCERLLEAVGSPFFRAAFDPANFVQVGVAPFPDAFERLRPWFEYLQVKDARFETGEVVPAGEGDARFSDLLGALVAARFSGFVSLEPHLANSGPGGGPEAFERAAVALRRLLRDLAGVEVR